MGMDVRHLNHLIAIAEKGTIGKAAESLGISQPALTKSIRNLEAALQVRLLERRPRGVVPTVYGEAVIARGRLVHMQLHELACEIQALRSGAGGLVRIGIAQGVASRLIPAATVRLLASRPNVRFSVITGIADELVVLLAAGEIEFAVAAFGRQRPSSAVVEEFLFDDRPLVVVRRGHPLTRHTDLEPRQLQDCKWVLASVAAPLRRMLDQIFVSDNVPPPTPTIECDTGIYVKPMLMEDDFVGFLPRDEFTVEEKAGLLIGIPFKTDVAARPIGILRRRSGALSSFGRQLISEIKKVCREFGYTDARSAI